MNTEDFCDGSMNGNAMWVDQYGRPAHINCRCSFRTTERLLDNDELEREGNRLVEFAKELLT